MIKLEALALVTLIHYITNYVTTILIIISQYYLLASVANLWKQTHLERYVPVPLEQSFFYQIHTLETDLCMLLLNMKVCITTCRDWSRNLGQRSVLAKKGTFFEKRAPKNSTPSIQSLFLSVLYQNKVLYNFHKRGSIW